MNDVIYEEIYEYIPSEDECQENRHVNDYIYEDIILNLGGYHQRWWCW